MNETISALDRGGRKDESGRTIYTFLPIRSAEMMLQSIEFPRIYRISVFYTKLQKQGTFAKKVSVFKRKPSILVKKVVYLPWIKKTNHAKI